MNPVIVIPARLGSSRLPRKPLAPIAGTPMIVHVLRRAEAAACAPVFVACDGPEIAAAVEAAKGRAVVTPADLPSGSDRVHAALAHIDPDGAFDVVVNLQGDLPTLAPTLVHAVLGPLADAEVDIATLAAIIEDPREAADASVVKAVIGPRGGRALYFSRAAIPWGEGPLYHHIGIYAYRRAALARFVAHPPSPLERRERLEQLRALEAGMRIDVALVDSVPPGVDTPADLERIRALLR